MARGELYQLALDASSIIMALSHPSEIEAELRDACTKMVAVTITRGRLVYRVHQTHRKTGGLVLWQDDNEGPVTHQLSAAFGLSLSRSLRNHQVTELQLLVDGI